MKRELPIQVKMTQDEFNYIKKQADKMGLTMAGYIRYICYAKKKEG